MILQRPELAAHAANVCANWALIEWEMAWLYALLMGRSLPKIHKNNIPMHPAAIQIFDALNSLAPRIDLIERLLRLTAPQQVEQFERVLRDKIKKRFNERSVIAHGMWGLCDAYPDALILVKSTDHSKIYRKHDFVQVSKRILELRDEMQAFTSTVASALYARPPQQTSSPP